MDEVRLHQHNGAMKKKVRFIKSAASPQDFPYSDFPELALVGRSNAGKSSFVNAWLSQRIAKVSQVPGKTRLLQFFEVADAFNLVDMPGYGFAKRSKEEQLDWKGMVEAYFEERENLRGVMLIMDIRRDWSPDEQMLRRWLEELDIPLLLVLNKSDKLSKTEIIKRQKVIEKAVPYCPIFITSSLKKSGFEAMENFVVHEWLAEEK